MGGKGPHKTCRLPILHALQGEPFPDFSFARHLPLHKGAFVLTSAVFFFFTRAHQKYVVILSASEGSHGLKSALLFKGFFVASLLRMTVGFCVIPPIAAPTSLFRVTRFSMLRTRNSKKRKKENRQNLFSLIKPYSAYFFSPGLALPAVLKAL